MKILFITHYFPPEGNAPASRVYEMCKRWVRAGHEVTVITGAPNCPTGIVHDGYRNKPCHTEMMDGIRVVRVWTYIAANRGKIRRILNYTSFMVSATIAGLFARRPDVLIATSPQFFCGWAGVLVRMLRRLPFILEIRDIWPESIAAVGAMDKSCLLRFLESLEQRMYRAAHRIVTVGDGYRDQLVARGVPEDRISVVTNGVDRELFQPVDDDEALRRQYGLNGEFVCSYVGTVGMACGLEVVLRAGQILKARGRNDIKFMLVGDGAVRKQLQKMACEMGLDNVIFTGQQDKSLMPRFLATADACLVHLRRQELFKSVLPSKIFEAAGMGKPIVLGVEGYAAGLVQRARCGLPIEPENAEQLAAAVESLADDREWGRRMGEAGRQHVLRHFDREKLSNDYLAVISQVARSVHVAAG